MQCHLRSNALRATDAAGQQGKASATGADRESERNGGSLSRRLRARGPCRDPRPRMAFCRGRGRNGRRRRGAHRVPRHRRVDRPGAGRPDGMARGGRRTAARGNAPRRSLGADAPEPPCPDHRAPRGGRGRHHRDEGHCARLPALFRSGGPSPRRHRHAHPGSRSCADPQNSFGERLLSEGKPAGPVFSGNLALRRGSGNDPRDRLALGSGRSRSPAENPADTSLLGWATTDCGIIPPYRRARAAADAGPGRSQPSLACGERISGRRGAGIRRPPAHLVGRLCLHHGRIRRKGVGPPGRILRGERCCGNRPSRARRRVPRRRPRRPGCGHGAAGRCGEGIRDTGIPGQSRSDRGFPGEPARHPHPVRQTANDPDDGISGAEPPREQVPGGKAMAHRRTASPALCRGPRQASEGRTGAQP